METSPIPSQNFKIIDLICLKKFHRKALNEPYHETLAYYFQGSHGFGPSHPIHQGIEEDGALLPRVSTDSFLPSVSRQNGYVATSPRDHASTSQQFDSEHETSPRLQQSGNTSPIRDSVSDLISGVQPDRTNLPTTPPRSVPPQDSAGFVPAHSTHEPAVHERVRRVEHTAIESFSYTSHEDIMPKTTGSTDTSSVLDTVTQVHRDQVVPYSLQSLPVTGVQAAQSTQSSALLSQPSPSVGIVYSTNVDSVLSHSLTSLPSADASTTTSQPALHTSMNKVYTVSPQGGTNITYTHAPVLTEGSESASFTTASGAAASSISPLASQDLSSIASDVQYTVPGYSYVVPYSVPATTNALPQSSLATHFSAAPGAMTSPVVSMQDSLSLEDRQIQFAIGTTVMSSTVDGGQSSSNLVGQQDSPVASRPQVSGASTNTSTTWDNASHTDQENIGKVSQEGPVIKVSPRRFVVTSKDPSEHTDGVLGENSDLPLASSSSFSPNEAIFRTGPVKVETGSGSKTDSFLNQPTPQSRYHRRTKSTGSTSTSLTGSNLQSELGKSTPGRVVETTTPSGLRVRRFQVLQSEPDSFQKDVVGVVNIKPEMGSREEAGAFDEAGGGNEERDVISISHLVDGSYEDHADVMPPTEVRARPQTVDSSTTTERYF